jgi:hypothetical protein
MEAQESLGQSRGLNMGYQQRDHSLSVLLEGPLNLFKRETAVKPFVGDEIDELNKIGPLVVHQGDAEAFGRSIDQPGQLLGWLVRVS